MATSRTARDRTPRSQAAAESTFDELFHHGLQDVDPDIVRLMRLEDERQVRKINLIASESLAPMAVRQASDSPFANIYAEGLPSTRMSRIENDRLDELEHHLAYYRRFSDRRYYKGCEYANFVESIAQRRAAELFATDGNPEAAVRVAPDEIRVNVQPLSGAAANNAVYTAFAKPGDTVMGMSLVTGGHLTHGSPVNRSGKIFNIVSYEIDEATGRLDYDRIRALAKEHRPRIIVAGFSAYPWQIDWAKFRSVCDEVGALLLADISHPSGLVAAGLFPSPIGLADVTMTTTHKTLCGPRGAILMSTDRDIAKAIDMAVFPGEQGGPHMHTIAAKAVAFKIAKSEAFRELQTRVLRNSRHFAQCLADCGLEIAYGGTESHLFLVDLKSLAAGKKTYPGGEVVSRILDSCGITVNKNSIAGDRSPLRPSGIRIGTTWISQQGYGDREIETLAGLIDRVLRAIRPFKPGGGAKGGRGRISFEVMEEVRKEVEQLVRSLHSDSPEPIDFYAYSSSQSSVPERMRSPLASEHAILGGRIEPDGVHSVPADYGDGDAEIAAATDRAALVDLCDGGLVNVGGERALEFLQQTSTGDVAQLDPGQGVRTVFLDGEGSVRADAVVLRRPDAETGETQYVLSTAPGATKALVGWLRALSDGYVEVESDDLVAKIDGPVAVEDLRIPRLGSERRTRLLLVGPKAAEILARVWNGASALEPGTSCDLEWENGIATIFRQPDRGTLPCFDVHVHPSAVSKAWSALLEAGRDVGVVPMGWESWAAVRKTHGSAELGITGAEAYRRDPVGFAIEKPYFVGQSAFHEAAKPAAPARSEALAELPEEPLRRTPIYERHLEQTMASLMAPFGGWEMPLWYTKVSEEHEAVREAVALFDVTHMGVLSVRGRDAERFLDTITTNFVAKLRPGRSQYSYLLDADGVVIDDIIVYRMADEEYQVVVNAANAERVLAWMRAVAAREVVIDRDIPERAVDARPEILDLRDPSMGAEQKLDIALQGPKSLELIESLVANEEQGLAVRGLGGFSHCDVKFGDLPVIVSRTGYTGETFGYELFVHPDHAVAVWDLLLDKGASFGIRPAGLAARDSTRMEAGFPLYGHELAGEYGIDPIEAGYGKFVKFHKPFFIGREPLRTSPNRAKRKMIRFRAKGRRFEIGDPIVDSGGETIGHVTSCTLVGKTILGLAIVNSKAARASDGLRIGSARRGGDPRTVEVLKRFPNRTADHGPLDPPMED